MEAAGLHSNMWSLGGALTHLALRGAPDKLNCRTIVLQKLDASNLKQRQKLCRLTIPFIRYYGYVMWALCPVIPLSTTYCLCICRALVYLLIGLFKCLQLRHAILYRQNARDALTL